MNYHLAIDIGASSGRLVMGYLDHDRLVLKEIYRFENAFHMDDGHLVWSLPYLWQQIILGLKACVKAKMIPKTIGIDTWGVDFVLLDKEGKQISPCVAYRDRRTDGMDDLLHQHISEQALYEKTSIQKQIFNTIYQLTSLKESQPDTLDQAAHFLLIPDYFNYLLTGKTVNEYTNATTTSLLNVKTGLWDEGLIKLVGLSPDVFPEIVHPGHALGSLRPELVQELGFDSEVIIVPSHDTASAFLAAPIEHEDDTIISSGTWSLLGRAIKQPIISEQSRLANFTNEGGYGNTYRYLKNIMGLWIIQECRRLLNSGSHYEFLAPIGHELPWTFANIERAAATATGYPGRINVDDDRYLAPDDMILEIYSALCDQGAQKPQTIEDILFCVYASLAKSYAANIALLDECTGRKSKHIYVVGGGSKDLFLNTLTAREANLALKAGPTEATAIGNLLVQFISKAEIKNKEEARKLVKKSFEIKEVDHASI